MTVITTATQLQNMKNDLTADYELGNNIDCSGIANFEPVGGWNGADLFTGSFDGKGFKISNLTINRAADIYIGLFGGTHSATIQNVELIDCIMASRGYSGCLIGSSAFDTIIRNCSSTGTISAVWHICGGLLGNTASIIDNCQSSVVVSGEDDVGGIVGSAPGAIITGCYSTGNVTGTGWSVGGFAGSASGTISKCYTKGNVTTSGTNYCGGFVGRGVGTFQNCYSLGNATITAINKNYVGGFVGYLLGTCINCYSIGIPTGDVGKTGGFAGSTYTPTFADCFWDTDASGTVTGIGDMISPEVTGKTTAQMKDLNTILTAGWSIPSIWNVNSGCNGGYPCLVGVNPCCSTSAMPPVDPTIAPKKVSLELIRNIEMMNTGRAYIDKSGNFVYESRFHR